MEEAEGLSLEAMHMWSDPMTYSESKCSHSSSDDSNSLISCYRSLYKDADYISDL